MKRILIWTFLIAFIPIYLNALFSYQSSPIQASVKGAMCAIVVCIAVVIILMICKLLKKAGTEIGKGLNKLGEGPGTVDNKLEENNEKR